MATEHRHPALCRDAGYEYQAVVLGRRQEAERQVATLARSGWELTDLYTPHYGVLTIIGHFRRKVPRLVPRAAQED